MPEDQTQQHPQELEQKVPKANNFGVHMITVNAAEDVTMKILSFFEQQPEEA
ncbi:hypothetical protein A2U01_0048347, partial [Trifolium medium]|nr:hypothetical protein [Trifolium medium]